MSDLSTILFLACLAVPVAVMATTPDVPLSVVRTLFRPTEGEWQLALIRNGRVLVLDTYAAERPCVDDAIAYTIAVRSARGWKPDATGHSSVICCRVDTSRRV